MAGLMMVGGAVVLVVGLAVALVRRKKNPKPAAIVAVIGGLVMMAGTAMPSVPSAPAQDEHEAEIVAAYEQVAAANDKCTEAYSNYSLIPMLGDNPEAAAKSKDKGDALCVEAVNLMAASSDAVDAVNALPSDRYGDVIVCMDAYVVEVGARIGALSENAANGEYSTDDVEGVAGAYGKLSVAAGKLNVELGDEKDS